MGKQLTFGTLLVRRAVRSAELACAVPQEHVAGLERCEERSMRAAAAFGHAEAEMQSGRTWGEVCDDEDRIRAMLEGQGFSRADAGFEDIVCLVQSRECLVRKMATAKPLSRLWDELSKEIVGVECLLAPHGLV